MYKTRVLNLLFTLLCLMLGSVVRAQNQSGTFVTPTLSSDGEVCIFLQSPEHTETTAYYFWGYGNAVEGGDSYDKGKTFSNVNDQEKFEYVGQQADGLYLYKWTRPANVTIMPTGFVISKNGLDEKNKIYNNVFSNHGIYLEENKTTYTRTFEHRDLSTETDPKLGSADEHTLYFETSIERPYYIWAWSAEHNGGAYFTGTTYPGALLQEVRRLDNGHYLYKWTQSVNTTDKPDKFILASGSADADKLINEADFTSSYWTETLTENDNTPQASQVSTAHTKIVLPTTTLDPIATLNSQDEISIFLESTKQYNPNSTYNIWVWNDTHTNGELTPGYSYPGPSLQYIGELKNKPGHYLYKWTENPSIHSMPTGIIINKGDGDSNKLLENSTFTNHGYYIVSDDETTATYQDNVIRQADGSYATSRTTYGQRVIYELNFGAFTDAAEGQKINAATNRLDYLKDLGVDVIWLMPIYQRDKGGSPYAATDLTKVNSRYGTEAELKNFVSEAHVRGMDVWLDFAANHVGVNNVWLQGNATNSNYHPEYFTKGTDNGYHHPNPVYKDVYELDYKTLVDTPSDSGSGSDDDADAGTVQVNPATEAIKQILLDWVDKLDIDGYRFDMVSSTTIPDAFWNEVTTALKEKKSSMQFLAEKDFAQDHNVDPTYFNYDYAWDYNVDLRNFGPSTNASTENDNSALMAITQRRVNDFDKSQVDPMIYLTNHDVNWNETPNTLTGTWGANRYNMTVYEFTMPGMPLIYNGQEQDGSVAVDYFNENPISWATTKDHNMQGLIRELAYLKHTNAALNDGYNKDMRGDLRMLNSYNHNILAYERIKGDKHVLVVLNMSSQPINSDQKDDGFKAVTIQGATEGTWTRVLQGGSGFDFNTSNVSTVITNTWSCTDIPANSYSVYTFTGPKVEDATAGLYFVTEDNLNNPTKHPMVRNSDGTYTLTLEAADFDALNTKEGNSKPDDNDTQLEFKFQEYYSWQSRVLKKDKMFGAGTNASANFKNAAHSLSESATVDGTTDDDSHSFILTNDWTKDGKKALRYVITYKYDTDPNKGTVTLRVMYEGDLLNGYYLLTPKNIEGDGVARHQWRFKPQGEDPDAVGDNYLQKIITDTKENLCSFTIDADLFDYYMPADRQNDVIQFRILQVGDNKQGVPTDNVADIDPDVKYANTDSSTFDIKKPNWYYNQAHWDPYDPAKECYFTLKKSSDVSKYIIQFWTSGSLTKVKVRYIRRFNYTGSTIEDITASNEDVYLYNVDAQKFVYVGNEWGTMASLLYSDLGTRMNISPGLSSDVGDYKMIRTKFENNTTVPNGHMLGIDDFTYNWDNSAFNQLDSANIFTDRDNGNMWLIEKIDNETSANTYTMRLYNTHDERYHFMRAYHEDGDSEETKRKNTQVIYVAQKKHVIDSDMLQENGHYTRNGNAVRRRNNARKTYFSGLGKGTGNNIYYEYIAPKNGSYEMAVKYLTVGDKNLTIKIDDNEYTQVAPNVGIATNRDQAKTITYKFHLNAGKHNVYIGYQKDEAPNITNITTQMTRPDDLRYARWQFVTYKDLVEKLRNDNAEVYNGTWADATFLMKDQGFTRYIPNTWDTDKDGSASYNISNHKDGDEFPATYSSSKSTVTCTKNTIGDDRDNGMYWNGHINGTGLVYQDIDVPVYGVYQVDAYGFYHGSKTRMFYQYATKINDDGSVVWSDMHVGNPLKYNPNGYNGEKATDVATGEEFYKESVLKTADDNTKYLNTLFVYVPEGSTDSHPTSNNGNYRIRIGFYKTGADQDNGNNNKDYTAVDDVHLHYCGKSAFTLKDEWEPESLTTARNNENRQNVPVYLKRKFTTGIWNTIVVPVPVDVSTLLSTFGSEVELAKPYGLDDNDPYLIKFTKVDLSNANGGIAIEPGKFYIIKPSERTGLKTVVNVNNSTAEVTDDDIPQADYDNGLAFYFLGKHDMSTNGDIQQRLANGVASLDYQTPGFQSTSQNHPEHNSIRIIGSYTKTNITATTDAQQKQGLYRYVFTNKGVVARLTRNRQLSMGGYRFYIEDFLPKTESAKTYTYEIGSLDNDLYSILDSYNKKADQTTGIDGVTRDNSGYRNLKFDGNVYDLSGRRVAVDGKIDSLPSGVYIFNGKKFIKK